MWVRPSSSRSDALSSKPRRRRSEGGSRFGRTAPSEHEDTDHRQRLLSDRNEETLVYSPNHQRTTKQSPGAKDECDESRFISSRREGSPDGLRKADRKGRFDSQGRTSATQVNRHWSDDATASQKGRAIVSDDAPRQSAIPYQADLSVRVPNQFPNQTPLDFALPYRPPMRSAGSAAEYYGDHGESVARQPGIRPATPVVTGAEAHLTALSPHELPNETGLGLAANSQTFADLRDFVSLSPPRPFLAPSPPSKLANHHTQSSAFMSSAAELAAGAAELSAVASKQHHEDPPLNPHSKPGGRSSLSISNVHSDSRSTLGMANREHHRERGPVGRLVDWWKNYEDVRKMEEYTEYIGVCRSCFDPHSSARDGPREHRPRKRSSLEFRSNQRVDKDNRYSTSENERRESRIARGIRGPAGYGIAKVLQFQKQSGAAFDAYKTRDRDGDYAVQGRRFSDERRTANSRDIMGHAKGWDSSPSKSQPRRPRKQSYILDRSDHSRSRSRSADKVTGLLGLGDTRATGMVKRSSGSHEKNQRFSVEEPRKSRTFHDVQRHASERLASPTTASARAPRFISQESYRQSSVRVHDSSSETDSTGGFFNKFFSRSGGRRRRSGTKTKDMPYISANQSTLSFITNIAHARKRDITKPTTLHRREPAGHASARETLLGLGVAAAVLATAGPPRNLRRNRHDDLTPKEQRNNHPNGVNLSSRRHTGGGLNVSSADDWESATEDDDKSSVSSGLAFGDYGAGSNLSTRRSAESLSSAASTSGKWGWRGGKRKDGKRTSSPRRKYARGSNEPQPSPSPLPTSVPVSSTNSRNLYTSHTQNTARLARPLQYIQPMPTSELNDSDLKTRSDDRPFASRSVIDSPSENTSFRQPQPRSPPKDSYATNPMHGLTSTVYADGYSLSLEPTKLRRSRPEVLPLNVPVSSPTRDARYGNPISQHWDAGTSEIRPFINRGVSAPVTGTMAREVGFAGARVEAVTGAPIKHNLRAKSQDLPSSEGHEVLDESLNEHHPQVEESSWPYPIDKIQRQGLEADRNAIEVGTVQASDGEPMTAKVSTMGMDEFTHEVQHHAGMRAVGPEIPEDQGSVQDDSGAIIHHQRPYEVRQQMRRAYSDPIYDDELFDPDLFKKPRKSSEPKVSVLDETVSDIFADVEQKYNKEQTTMAAFFAPPELSRPSQSIDTGSNFAHEAQHDNDRIESTEEDFPLQRTANAHFIPKLTVIAPTPPGSTAGFNRGGWSRDVSPIRSPIEPNFSTPEFAATDAVPRVSMMQPESKVLEVQRLQEHDEDVSHAEEYGSHSTTRPSDSSIIEAMASDQQAETSVHMLSHENSDVPRSIRQGLPESGGSTLDLTEHDQLIVEPLYGNEFQQSSCGLPVALPVSNHSLSLETSVSDLSPPTTAFGDAEISEDFHLDPERPVPGGDSHDPLVMNTNSAGSYENEKRFIEESYEVKSREAAMIHDEPEYSGIRLPNTSNGNETKIEHRKHDSEVSQPLKTPPPVSGLPNSRVHTEDAVRGAQHVIGHDMERNENSAEVTEPVVGRSFSQKGSDALQRGMASVVAAAVMAGTAFGTPSIKENAAEHHVFATQEPITNVSSERKMPGGFDSDEEFGDSRRNGSSNDDLEERSSSTVGEHVAAAQKAVNDTPQLPLLSKGNDVLLDDEYAPPISEEKEKEFVEGTFDKFEVSKKSKSKKSKSHAASSNVQADNSSIVIEGWATKNNKKSKKSKRQNPRYSPWTPEPDEHEYNATDRPRTAVRDEENSNSFKHIREGSLGDEVDTDRSLEPSGPRSNGGRSNRRDKSQGAALDSKQSDPPFDKAYEIKKTLDDSDTKSGSRPKKSRLKHRELEQDNLRRANTDEDGPLLGQSSKGFTDYPEPNNAETNKNVAEMAFELEPSGSGPSEKRRQKKSKRRSNTDDMFDTETASEQQPGSRFENGPLVEKTMVDASDEWAQATSRRSRKSDLGMSSQVKATKVDTSSPRWRHFEVDEQTLTSFEDSSHANEQDVNGQTVNPGSISQILPSLLSTLNLEPTESRPIHANELISARLPHLSRPLDVASQSECEHEYANAGSPAENLSVLREIPATLRSYPQDRNVLPESLPLPESRPSSPHVAGDQSGARSPSSTAVPLRFRRPPQSPGLPRDPPVALPSIGDPSSPSTAGRVRTSRPTSTEFKSSTEFMPLYLVERNRKVPEPEETLPSLPSSRTTSRSSSVLDSEDAYESAPESQGNTPGQHGLSIETDFHGPVDHADYPDSQQTTPKAIIFPSGMSHALDGLEVLSREQVSDDLAPILDMSGSLLPTSSTLPQGPLRLGNNNLITNQQSLEALLSDAGFDSRDTRSTASKTSTTHSAPERPLNILSNLSLGAVATTAALLTAAVASPVLIAGAVLHKDDNQALLNGQTNEEIELKRSPKLLYTGVMSQDSHKSSENPYSNPPMPTTSLGELTPNTLGNEDLYQDDRDRVPLEEGTLVNRAVIEEIPAPKLKATRGSDSLLSTSLSYGEDRKKGRKSLEAASGPDEGTFDHHNISLQIPEDNSTATAREEQDQVSKPKISSEHNSGFFPTLLRSKKGKKRDWKKNASREDESGEGQNSPNIEPPSGVAESTSKTLSQQDSHIDTKGGDQDDSWLSPMISRIKQGRKAKKGKESASRPAQKNSPSRTKSLSPDTGNDEAFLTKKSDKLSSIVGRSDVIPLDNAIKEELFNGAFDTTERSPGGEYISSKAAPSHFRDEDAAQVPLPESHDSDLEGEPGGAEQSRSISSAYFDIFSATPDPMSIPLPESLDSDLEGEPGGAEQPRSISSAYFDIFSAPPDPMSIPLPESLDSDLEGEPGGAEQPRSISSACFNLFSATVDPTSIPLPESLDSDLEGEPGEAEQPRSISSTYFDISPATPDPISIPLPESQDSDLEGELGRTEQPQFVSSTHLDIFSDTLDPASIPLPECQDSNLEGEPDNAEQPRSISSTRLDLFLATPDPALIPLPASSDGDLTTVSNATDLGAFNSAKSSGSRLARSPKVAGTDTDFESVEPEPTCFIDSPGKGSARDLLLQNADIGVLNREEQDLSDFARLIPLPEESDSEPVCDSVNAVDESLWLPLRVDGETNETFEESLDRNAIDGASKYEPRVMPGSFPSPGRLDTILGPEPRRHSSSMLPDTIPLPGDSDNNLEVSVIRHVPELGLDDIVKSDEVYEDKHFAGLQRSLSSLQSKSVRPVAEGLLESNAPSEEDNPRDSTSIALRAVESPLDNPEPQPNEEQKDMQDEIWSVTSKKRGKKAKGRKSAQQDYILEVGTAIVTTNSRGRSEVDIQAADPGVDDLANATTVMDMNDKQQNEALTSDALVDIVPSQTGSKDDGFDSQPSLESAAAESNWFTTPNIKGKKGKNKKRLFGVSNPGQSDMLSDAVPPQLLRPPAHDTYLEQPLVSASAPEVKAHTPEDEGNAMGDQNQEQEMLSRAPSHLVEQHDNDRDSNDANTENSVEQNKPPTGKAGASLEPGFPTGQISTHDVKPREHISNDNAPMVSTLEERAKLARTGEKKFLPERNDLVEDKFTAVSKAAKKKQGKDKRRGMLVSRGDVRSLISGSSIFGDIVKNQSDTASKPSKKDRKKENGDQVQEDPSTPASDGEPKGLMHGEACKGGDVPGKASLKNLNFAPRGFSEEPDGVQISDNVPPVDDNLELVRPSGWSERELPVEGMKLSRQMVPTMDEDEDGKNGWSSALSKDNGDNELQQDLKLPLDMFKSRNKSDFDARQNLNEAEAEAKTEHERREIVETLQEKPREKVEVDLGAHAVTPSIIEMGSIESREPEAKTGEPSSDTKTSPSDAAKLTTSDQSHLQSMYNGSEFQAQQSNLMVSTESPQGFTPEQGELHGDKREQLSYSTEDHVHSLSSISNGKEHQRVQDGFANTADIPDHPASASLVSTLSGAIAGSVGMLFGSSFVKFKQGKNNTEETKRIHKSKETGSEPQDLKTIHLPEKHLENLQEDMVKPSIPVKDDLIDRSLVPSSKKSERDKANTKKSNNVGPDKSDFFEKLDDVTSAEAKAEHLSEEKAAGLQHTGDTLQFPGQNSDLGFVEALGVKRAMKEDIKSERSQKHANDDESSVMRISQRPENVEEENDRYTGVLEYVSLSEQSNSEVSRSLPKNVYRHDTIANEFEPLPTDAHTPYPRIISMKDDSTKQDEIGANLFINKEHEHQNAAPRYAVVEAPSKSGDELYKPGGGSRTLPLQSLAAAKDAEAFQDGTAKAVLVPLPGDDNDFDIEHEALTGIPSSEHGGFQAQPSSLQYRKVPDHSLIAFTAQEYEHSGIQAVPRPAKSRERESRALFDDGAHPTHPSESIHFAAILAAGLEDTGFDSNLVLGNPSYHQTSSAPDFTLAVDDSYTWAEKSTKKARRRNTQQSLEDVKSSEGQGTTNLERVKEDTFDDIVSTSLGNAGYDPSKFRVGQTGDHPKQTPSLAANEPDFGPASASFTQKYQGSSQSSAIRPSDAWRSSPSPPRTPALIYAQHAFGNNIALENSDSQQASAPRGIQFPRRVSEEPSDDRKDSVATILPAATLFTVALEVARSLESETSLSAFKEGSNNQTQSTNLTNWNAEDRETPPDITSFNVRHVGDTQGLCTPHTLSQNPKSEENLLTSEKRNISAEPARYYNLPGSTPSKPTSPPYVTKDIHHQELVKVYTQEETQHHLEPRNGVENQAPRIHDLQRLGKEFDMEDKFEQHTIKHSRSPDGHDSAPQQVLMPAVSLQSSAPHSQKYGPSQLSGLDTLPEDSIMALHHVHVPPNDDRPQPSMSTSAGAKQTGEEESDFSRSLQQPSQPLQDNNFALFSLQNASSRPARTPTNEFQPEDFKRPERTTSTPSRPVGILRGRSGTPTLRRMDRSLNGDLRAASKRGQAQANGANLDERNLTLERRESYDPLKGNGRDRRQETSNGVFNQGKSDVRSSPHSSPTLPPVLRNQKSVMDRERKLDHVLSDNRSLQEADGQRQGSSSPDTHALKQALEARDLKLREKEDEINSIKAHLQELQDDVTRLSCHNEELTAANRNLSEDTNERYATLQVEHDHTHHQWQQSSKQLDELKLRHEQLTSGMEDVVHEEISTALEEKNFEIRSLRTELEYASDQIRILQRQILVSKQDESFLDVRNEDYFDSACQQLCQHVQQWVLRFSKFSDNRVCRLLRQLHDEKIETRIDNAILDGSDTDVHLSDRVGRRDVFMSVVMAMIWEFIFTRYLFGMDREQRQKLKALEKILAEVGPLRAVAQWRATTLSLLSRRETFFEQRSQDTEAVVQEIYKTLAVLLPPPNNLVNQIQDSLRNVLKRAVDLSIQMRTQRAEYIMLPPLQPEYDSNGDLTRKVYFNASLMNERSGETTSNEQLESRQSIVRLVLFPLVVKKGNDLGDSDEEVVVCPAQVLVAKPTRQKKMGGMVNTAISIGEGNQSMQSATPSTLDLNSFI